MRPPILMPSCLRFALPVPVRVELTHLCSFDLACLLCELAGDVFNHAVSVFVFSIAIDRPKEDQPRRKQLLVVSLLVQQKHLQVVQHLCAVALAFICRVLIDAVVRSYANCVRSAGEARTEDATS